MSESLDLIVVGSGPGGYVAAIRAAVGPGFPISLRFSQFKEVDYGARIADTPAELVVIGTPIDLRRLIDIDKPTARVRYELQEIGSPTLTEVLEGFGD